MLEQNKICVMLPIVSMGKYSLVPSPLWHINMDDWGVVVIGVFPNTHKRQVKFENPVINVKINNINLGALLSQLLLLAMQPPPLPHPHMHLHRQHCGPMLDQLRQCQVCLHIWLHYLGDWYGGYVSPTSLLPWPHHDWRYQDGQFRFQNHSNVWINIPSPLLHPFTTTKYLMLDPPSTS